ncbi:MAG: hypothetical protein ACOYEA_01030 [Fermentimonas sp.]|jgi:Spy/CpxP family protein refolding chaperone
MKKYALMTLLMMLTLSINVSAQSRQNRRVEGVRANSSARWDAEARAENMAKQLDLTDSQKEQVSNLLKEQDKAREARMAEHRATNKRYRDMSQEERAKMQELRMKEVEKNDADLEKIIGKDKMAQWKKYREERRNSRPMRNANRGR